MRALGAAVLALVTAVLFPGPPAAATPSTERTAIEWRRADAGDFRPGLLISDDRFYDASAMRAEEVQAFLERRVCIPEDGVPCLEDFRSDTPDVPDQGFGHCAPYRGAESEEASRIVAKVAAACGINPQVLLVLLQKEQSLLTRPSAFGYERATGYACPDTAACDARYFGFFNQVYRAAWQFRQYTLYPTDRAAEIGRVSIAYSPDASCGAAPVDIRNQATANLYNYTPYQPNAAALARLYGSGDACSSYGNRNFWRIFTDWFGDPAAVRFPEFLGRCVLSEAGSSCVETYWVAPPPR
ncbi:hypothetical protein [Naasia sp. SYSU D00948]|uniref:hypothetical protein n=1 Tax=Naasia sp. SYSU D00948 TaxID=2817379 RepID=UPI001FEF20DB|nr:hypothetical protein [Naasia sp. SYSU D00948]